MHAGHLLNPFGMSGYPLQPMGYPHSTPQSHQLHYSQANVLSTPNRSGSLASPVLYPSPGPIRSGGVSYREPIHSCGNPQGSYICAENEVKP